MAFGRHDKIHSASGYVSDDNVVVSRIKKITVPPPPCPCNEMRPARGRSLQKAALPVPSFAIFPNPVSQGTLFVQTGVFPASETIAYKITDVWGRAISSGFPEALSEAELGLPVAGLADGLYFLQLLLPGGVQQTHKFIIAKTH